MVGVCSLNWRRAVLLGFSFALGLLPSLAQASRPFDDTDLFSGHALRQSSKDRKIAFGINAHAAPIPFVAAKALDKATEQASAKLPGASDMIGVLKNADPQHAKDLADAGNISGLQQYLKDAAAAHHVTLSAAQLKAINGINARNVSSVADIAQVAGQPSNAFAFGLEPWAEYNFGTYDLTAYVPLAGFRSDDGTTMQLGNINLDFRAGSRRGMGIARYAWTGGLSLYLPTGSKDANVLALSNILVLPKYLHEYLTVQPYAIGGFELGILSLMGRLEYTHMQAVRDNPFYSSVDYLNWGASGVLHLVILDFVGEIDGLTQVHNAPAMRDILGTVGLRIHVGPVRMGVGARMPLTQTQSSLYAQSLGSTFANVAKVNVLLQGILSF